ncbi:MULTISPECIES: Com family DNA-binding transcriptional regulator [Halomonas]|uniref:Com family DNA-binding transcriptional regulator n=1 Tax=Halomonas TaxID=2745 RepID=UPI000EEB43B3|nr:Com family DNA-binding transcriptional regulator [Halomonas sp.]
MLIEIRCKQCNRKLANVSDYQFIEIKCPRCKHLNQQRATSSKPLKEKMPRGYPNHSLDGRQAPSG